MSPRIDGHWSVVSIDAGPAGLIRKHSKQLKQANHRRKHHWPAKRGHKH